MLDSNTNWDEIAKHLAYRGTQQVSVLGFGTSDRKVGYREPGGSDFGKKNLKSKFQPG